MARETTFGSIWRKLAGGQQEALGQKLYLAGGGEKGGEETLKALLDGDLEVIFRDASKMLVDQNGRCIPTKDVTMMVCDANRNFRLIQPEIDYADILTWQQKFFPPEMQFVSVMEFEERSKTLLAKVGDNKQVKNLRHGVYLPFCLPKLTVTDYGRTLEEIFLAAVERSYCAQFPDRTFVNYRKGELAGQITVVAESRHQQLIDTMRERPVVGILFPTALQGFGIEAGRQMIRAFPDGFALTGAIDFAAVHVAYPETLALDCNVPVSDCSANVWRDPECSLCLNPDDGRLGFGYRGLVAREGCSGGVVVFG